MNATNSDAPTLEDLRRCAGLTLEDVAAKLAAILGEESRSHVSIWKIEKHGTDKLSIRDGLADIYGVKPEVIETAMRRQTIFTQS